MAEEQGALRKILAMLTFKVASTGPAEAAANRVTAVAHHADRAWGALGGAIAGALAVGAIRGQINAVADAVDASRKQSEALGVSVEWLQRTQHAASLAGVSSEELAKHMLFLNRAATNTPELLRDLGVATVDAGGNARSTDAMLLNLADRFHSMPDGPRKSAAAMDVFGRSGAKMIPLLNGGSAAMREAQDEATALGLVLSESEARGMEEYNDTMERTKAVFRGVRNRLVVELLPALTRVGQRFVAWAKDGDRVRRMAQVVQRAVSGIAAAFVARKLVSGASAFIGILRAIGNAGALASAKMALLVGGLALLALVVEDLYTFATGGDSLIGRMLGKGEAENLRAALTSLATSLRKVWEGVKPGAVAALKRGLQWFADHAGDIANAIGGVVYAIGAVFDFVSAAFVVTGEAIGKAAGWLVIAWGDAVDWLSAAIGDTVDWVVAAWQGAVEWVSAALASVVGFFAAIGSGIASLATGAISALSGLWQWATDAVAAVGAFLASLGDGISGWITGAIEGLLDELRGVVNALPSQVVPDSLLEWANAGAAKPAWMSAPTQAMQAAQAARAQQSLSVGTVAVNVAGSADMSAPAMQDAVRVGVQTAINDIFGTALADLGAEG